MYHWLPSYFSIFPFGKVGVDMFFVLSGFLITEILLRQRNASESFNLSKIKTLYVFYVRRALRIFPIYYIVVLIFLFLRYEIVKENSGYFFLYGVNFLIIKNEQWLKMLSHLWSLSVEEQFYLVWPFFILFFPKKRLGYVIGGLIILSLIYVGGSHLWGNEYSFVNILFCVSTLGAGGILAFLKNRLTPINTKGVVSILIMCMFVFYVCSLKFLNVIWFHLSVIFYSCAFLIILLQIKNKFLDFIFNNRFFSWLGKISYGLYLFHNIIPWLLRNLNGTETEFKILSIAVLPASYNGYINLVLQFGLLIFVAALSWYCIEKPVNSLKDKINY